MKGRLLTNAITPEERLEKIHVSLMRDKRTALFSGIMLMALIHLGGLLQFLPLMTEH